MNKANLLQCGFFAAVVSFPLFAKDRLIDDGCTKVELFGNTSIESSEIFGALSFVNDAGCVSLLDQTELNRECELLKERFPEISVIHCGHIVFGDYRTLEVSLLEYIEMIQLQEKVSRYRPDKRKAVELDESLSPLYVQHRELWFDAVRSGEVLGEHVKDNVLRYTLPELDEIATTLAEKVSPEREFLESVIQNSSLTNHRIAAAWLLPWADPSSETINNTMGAILDESQLVRNNYGRFLHFFMEKIEDLSTLEKLANLAFIQLKMPAHSDRNKAIHILLELSSRNHLNCDGFANNSRRRQLEVIADRSAIPNVGGVAKEIIQRIEARCE